MSLARRALAVGASLALVVAGCATREARLLADAAERRASACGFICRATTAPKSQVTAQALASARDDPPDAIARAMSGKSARPLGWRVFARPWCCGECCYSTACFPCYRKPVDYVEERIEYLSILAGVAPPTPPPVVILPDPFVPIVRPGIVGGFAADATAEETRTSRGEDRGSTADATTGQPVGDRMVRASPRGFRTTRRRERPRGHGVVRYELYTGATMSARISHSNVPIHRRVS